MGKGPISFEMKGAKQMMTRIQKVAEIERKKVEKALYRRANLIMTRSKREFVPVDDGPLRASGKVWEPETKGNKTKVMMTYGDSSAPYATSVHEHLSDASPYSWKKAESEGRPVQFHPSGRGPKFLERPLLEALTTMARDMAEDLHL